jgi:hypothetical protein
MTTQITAHFIKKEVLFAKTLEPLTLAVKTATFPIPKHVPDCIPCIGLTLTQTLDLNVTRFFLIRHGISK